MNSSPASLADFVAAGWDRHPKEPGALAADLLAAAELPIIHAGSGIIHAGACDALRRHAAVLRVANVGRTLRESDGERHAASHGGTTAPITTAAPSTRRS